MLMCDKVTYHRLSLAALGLRALGQEPENGNYFLISGQNMFTSEKIWIFFIFLFFCLRPYFVLLKVRCGIIKIVWVLGMGCHGMGCLDTLNTGILSPETPKLAMFSLK